MQFLSVVSGRHAALAACLMSLSVRAVSAQRVFVYPAPVACVAGHFLFRLAVACSDLMTYRVVRSAIRALRPLVGDVLRVGDSFRVLLYRVRHEDSLV